MEETTKFSTRKIFLDAQFQTNLEPSRTMPHQPVYDTELAIHLDLIPPDNMEWEGLEWEDIKIDDSLPPLLPAITKRPVDLTVTTDRLYAAPRQYIWAVRTAHMEPGEDRPKPATACEVGHTTFSHEFLLNHLQIYHIAEPGVPYLRWELPNNPEVLTQLWVVLSLTTELKEWFATPRLQKTLLRRMQPVFVEHHNGLHFGRWAHDLGRRKNRIAALFVQLFGSLYARPSCVVYPLIYGLE